MNLVAGIRAQALERRAQALETVKQRRETTKQLIEQHRAAALAKVEEHRQLAEDSRLAALKLVEEYRVAATAKAEEQRVILAKKLGLLKGDKQIEAEQRQYTRAIMGEEPMNEDAYDSEGNSDQSLSDDDNMKALVTLSPATSTQSITRHDSRQQKKQERKEYRQRKEAERRLAKQQKKNKKEQTRRLKKQTKTDNIHMKKEEKNCRPLAICDVGRFFQPALPSVPEDSATNQDPFGKDRFQEISPHVTSKSTSSLSTTDSGTTILEAPTMHRTREASISLPEGAYKPMASTTQYKFALSSDDHEDATAMRRYATPFPSVQSDAAVYEPRAKEQTSVSSGSDYTRHGVSEGTRDGSPAAVSPSKTGARAFNFSTSSEDQASSMMQRWNTPYTPADTAHYLAVDQQDTDTTIASEAATYITSQALPKSTLNEMSSNSSQEDVQRVESFATGGTTQQAPLSTSLQEGMPSVEITRTQTRKPVPSIETAKAASSFTASATSTSPSTASTVERKDSAAQSKSSNSRYLSPAAQPRHLQHINQDTVYEPEFDARVPQKIRTADYARFRDKYEKAGKAVGSGAFGSVSVVRRRADKKSLFAVKEFRGRDSKESRMEYNRRVATEFCFASALNHPNVINTIEVLRDSDKWFQIMEFAPFDLFTAVKSQKMRGDEICCVFKQLMCGVEYLHSVGLAHRDLKLENLVLDAHGIIKIIDFGSAVVFRYPHEDKLIPATGFAGSEPYLAPEVLDQDEYMPAMTDVWSCAIIFCCMWNKRFPWKSPCFTDKDFRVFATEIPCEDEEQRLAALNISKVTTGKHKIQGPWRLLRHLPAEARPVIFNMLDLEPEDRATARELLMSTWLHDSHMCYLEDGSLHRKHEHILLSPE